MSTLKTINVIHPSGTTNNLVNDNLGSVTIGNNATITNNLSVGGSTIFTLGLFSASLTGGTTASSTLTLQSTSGVGTTDSIFMKVGNNGATTALSIATTGIVSFPTTGAIVLPVGTTVQEPTGQAGMLRFNTTKTAFEGYNGTSWGNIGGGATGGGTDQIFWNNGQTVTTNYTIPSNQNSGTFGPITIDSAATVTVPSTSTWTVV
jgi:hypothetical protein